jgi:hypothetical protein
MDTISIKIIGVQNELTGMTSRIAKASIFDKFTLWLLKRELENSLKALKEVKAWNDRVLKLRRK